MRVVAEAPRTVVVVEPRTVEAVEHPTAVAAVLTAIVRISAISTFRKGPPLFNEAGLSLSQSLQSHAIQNAAPQLSVRMRVKRVGQLGISKFDIAARSKLGNAAGRCYRKS
jgi:hypothetical protein